MMFAWENKRISKRGFYGYVTLGLRFIASTLVRQPMWIWVVGGIVIVTMVVCFLTGLQTSPVDAVSELNPPLDCLSCHTKILKGHDKLGSGNEACWTCHDKTEMTTLHLAGGETRFPLSDFPRLCAQCHQERYEAWNDGTHGTAWQNGQPTMPGTDKVECSYCHDPHQPQIVLSNITRSHPSPVPSPPLLPTNPVIMVGISLLAIVAVGLAIATKGGRP